MLIEGKNAVMQALLSNITINRLLVDKSIMGRKDNILSLAFDKKIKIEYLPKNILDKKSKTKKHQGFIAESIDFKYCDIEDILQNAKTKKEKPFIVLLDGIEDPHNFGAIIRTCECAGVHGIVITKNRSAVVNETVFKTSAGAVSNMLISKVINLKDTINFLKEQNILIFATDAKGDSIYTKNLNVPIALIIGSEGFGIKPTLLKYCDGIISLPLKGKVNSLNASVACGISTFEILRQRLEAINE